MERIESDIRELVEYGVRTGLVPREDVVFTVNRLLELFGLEEFGEGSELPEGMDGVVSAEGMDSGDNMDGKASRDPEESTERQMKGCARKRGIALGKGGIAPGKERPGRHGRVPARKRWQQSWRES